MLKGSLVFVGSLVFSANVLAFDNDFYLGGGVGLADMSASFKDTSASGLSEQRGNRVLTSRADHVDITDNAHSYRLLLGYPINNRVAAELAFYDLGTVDATRQTTAGFADGTIAVANAPFKLRTYGGSVVTRFSLPLSPTVSVLTNLGGAWSKQQQTYHYDVVNIVLDPSTGAITRFLSTPMTEKESQTSFDLSYGLGVSLKINPKLESRLMATGIELDDGRIFDYGLSLIYKL